MNGLKLETYEFQTKIKRSKMKLEPDKITNNTKGLMNLRTMLKKIMVKISYFLPKTQRQVYFELGQTDEPMDK